MPRMPNVRAVSTSLFEAASADSDPATSPAWAVCPAVVVAVGVSRAYLGVHWLTDIVGGWCFGACLLAAILLAAHALDARAAARRARSAQGAGAPAAGTAPPRNAVPYGDVRAVR